LCDDTNVSPHIIPEHVEAVFLAYEDIGIRAYVGITLFDRPFFRAVPFVDEEFPKEFLSGSRQFLIDYQGLIDYVAVSGCVRFTEQFTSAPGLHDKIAGTRVKRRAVLCELLRVMQNGKCFYDETHDMLPERMTTVVDDRLLTKPRPSILLSENGQFVAAPGLKDDGRLDTDDPRSVRELVEGKVLQMLRVPYDDVHHDIVTACHEESEPYLGHPRNVVHEAIDRAALVLGQFDHVQRF
jgi:hypothetical protein